MSYLFLRTGGASTPFTHVGFSDLVLAGLNTLILLASAVFAGVGAARHTPGPAGRLDSPAGADAGARRGVRHRPMVEFNHSGMRVDDSAFGGAFFALISFHALHVLAGMTVLGLNLARARLGDFTARRHVAVAVGTWFWYFVTAVWIVLFAVLYLV